MITSSDSLILAIDVGSSSVRARVFDSNGKVLEHAFKQIQYTMTTSSDGGVYTDPVALSHIIFEAIDGALLTAESDSNRIAVVAMDTLVSNLLGLDLNGQPTTPLFTWADTRGRDVVQNLRLALGDFTTRTGCRLHTSNWPVRLRWLAEHSPEIIKRTAYWMSLGDYLLYQIFGQRRVSLSAASWSGFLNRFDNTWDVTTVQALSIQPEQLSEVSDEGFSGLSGKWAERWPALKNAVWLPAIGDGVASNIGAGCTSNEMVALSVGTSGALRIVTPGRPAQVPDGLFAYCVDRDRSLVGGALSNAGNLYAWLRQTLAVPNELIESVDSMSPDSHGLTILPFLAGERAPGWNDQARAVFMGMTLDTTPAQLVRAGLEAIAYRFYRIAERLAHLLPANVAYIANGAAITNSPAWMQILADVLGAPVYSNLESEATIRGTALLASKSQVKPALDKPYLPDPQRRTIYLAAADRQQDLYQRLFGNGQ